MPCRFAVDAQHNGCPLRVTGYPAGLERDFADIADLQQCVGSRLRFECSPRATFLGWPVNGRNVVFRESVFYALRNDKIAHVWSVIDIAVIEAQLSRSDDRLKPF